MTGRGPRPTESEGDFVRAERAIASSMGDYVDTFEHRVRFTEVDLQGIVFYGHYFAFQDEAFSGYFRLIDELDPDDESSDWQVHVVNAEMDYRAQATQGDELVHGMRVERIGHSSIEWAHRVERQGSRELIAEGSLTHVAVDRETGESIRVPDSFRAAVRELQETPPVEE